MKLTSNIAKKAALANSPSLWRGQGGGCALALFLLFGCSTYEGEDPALVRQRGETANLCINVYAPAGQVLTRAGEYGDDFTTSDKVKATDAENAMHKVQIWAFEHDSGDDAQAIAYKDTTFTATTEGDVTTYVTEHTIQMPILKYYVEKKAKLDFWVVCNPGSTGLTADDLPANDSPTRAKLKALMFGHEGTSDYFGTTSRTSQVPAGGLPMTAVYKGSDDKGFELSTDGETIVQQKPNIELTRAISRVRFVFSRSVEASNVTIERITINGQSLPLKQYLFPAGASSYDAGSNAETTENSLVLSNTTVAEYPLFNSLGSYQGSTIIPPTDNPELLKQGRDGADATAQGYYDRIDEAINQNKACQFTAENSNYIYLRESYYQLRGTIDYTTDGNPGTATFITQTAADFSRNHTWIVYGYFNRGTLQLTVTAQPWWLRTTEMDYSNTLQVPENGTLQWTANTYDASNSYPNVAETDGIRTLTLASDKVAEGKFEITSPKGFIWTAMFRSVSGNPTAFTFTDAEGNNPSQTASGTVGLGSSTIYIKPAQEIVGTTSAAILTIVVRQGEGKNIPVEELSNYRIVQRANQ